MNVSNDPLAIAAFVIAVLTAGFTGIATGVARREGRRTASTDLLQRLDATREDRHRIRQAKGDSEEWEAVKNGDFAHIAEMDAAKVAKNPNARELLKAFDNVARAYDVAGLFDRVGMVPASFIDYFFAAPLDDLWEVYGFEQYVRWIRGSSDPSHLWELLALHERTQMVLSYHPAMMGKKSWPMFVNPRTGRLRWPQRGRVGTRQQASAVLKMVKDERVHRAPNQDD